MRIRCLQWFLLIFSIAFLLVLTILLFTEKDGDVIFKNGLREYGQGNLKISQTSQSKERAISQSTYIQRKSDYLPSQSHMNENQDEAHQEELLKLQQEYERDTDAAYLWGTYKPHLIHVITQRTPKPLTFGWIYVAVNEANRLYHSYKDAKEYAQHLTEYVCHNGKTFSQSVFDDQFSLFKVNNYFYKEKMSIGRQKWHSVTVRDENGTSTNSKNQASVIYYFLIEDFDGLEDQRYLEYDAEEGVINVRRPNEEPSESYKIIVYDDSKLAMNFSEVRKYVFVDNSTAKEDTWQIKDIVSQNMEFADGASFKTLKNNYEEQTGSTNLIGLQLVLDPNNFFAIDIVYDTWNEFEENEDNYTTINAIIKYPDTVFSSEYKKTFNKAVPADQQKCAMSALSNLISGIGYYYGSITVKNQNTEQPRLPLYTGCPSKTAFPRGFLWDEGFHGLVYCKWNMEICLDVLKHWMNTEIDGWIPREQLRGKESVSNGHPDYIAQIKNEANPPTLMFLVNALIESKERGHLPAGGAELLNTLYPKLKSWYDWFFTTQVSGKYDAVFTWKSSQADVGLVLGSGLDDYPRGLSGGGKKMLGHLDLQVWMIFMSDNMEKIARIAGKKDDVGVLRSLRVRLREQLKLFYDPAEKLHKDLVEDSNGNRRFSAHFGYVNLFPLFFGFIQKDSEELETLLNYISNPQKLWSKYGLLSLSKDDSLYMKTHDSYWGGPIWININYLTLRGLKLFYYSNPKARRIYEELRENVINTVKEQKEKSGYFFEQYNQDTGAGQKNYPFSGWTTTVLLIIYEQY